MGIELQHLPADVLGLSEVARSALAGRPRPAALPGVLVPDRPEAVPALEGPDAARFDGDARAELRDALERAVAPFEPHVNVLENIRRLEHPSAALVVAGQQPGFLGGPLYDVYKALTALRLARALEARWGVPVLPAFWNHSDDHDIAEVHHLWVQNAALDLRKVTLHGVSSGRTPLGRLRLDEQRHRLGATAELLRQTLPDYGARDEALELFLPRDGETFGAAFTRVLLRLFGHHGLIVFEPHWIRTTLSRSLAHVVASGVGAGLRAGSERLRAAGTPVAIEPDGAALVFRLVDGERAALRLAGEEFRYDDEAGARTGTELAAEIVQEPAEWSAGALLRPLVQDHALPTVAYVGGWGELAYHAQLPPLRAAAGVRTTAFVPRLSATLVDPALAKSLAKLGIEARAALVARGSLPEPEPRAASGSGEALRALGQRTQAELSAAREDLAALDRGLAQQLKKIAAQTQDALDKLAAKADRVADNARGTERRHRRRIANGLFPREEPQERVLGSLEVAARHGTRWIDALLEEIDVLPTEHVLVTLDEGDDS